MKKYFLATVLIALFTLPVHMVYAKLAIGLNAVVVKYNGNKGPGKFVQTDSTNGTWVEYLNGRSIHTYGLSSRENGSIGLFDATRNVNLLLDIDNKKVLSVAWGEKGLVKTKLATIINVGGPESLKLEQPANNIAQPTTTTIASPAADCGGLEQSVCLSRKPRCNIGLVEQYSYKSTCRYPYAKRYALSKGKPIPIVYPTLDPKNSAHAKLLARKIKLSLNPAFGSGLKLTAKGSDTFYSLARIYEKKKGAKPGSIELGLRNEENRFQVGPSSIPFDQKLTLAHYDIKNGTQIYVHQPHKCGDKGCTFHVSLYPIKGLTKVHVGGTVAFDAAKASDTIGDFRKRQKIATNTTLMYEGQVLENHRTFASYNMGIFGRVTHSLGGIFRYNAPPILPATVKEVVYNDMEFPYPGRVNPVGGIIRYLGDKKWIQHSKIDVGSTKKNKSYPLQEQSRDKYKILLYCPERDVTVEINYADKRVRVKHRDPGKAKLSYSRYIKSLK